MQFNTFLIPISLIFLIGSETGCAKSEKLDDNEMQYVKTTIAITKARIASHDSLQLAGKLDSVYKKFSTTKENYSKQTSDFSKEPDRAGIVFRAIADSLNVK
jgi:hypothetical protein